MFWSLLLLCSVSALKRLADQSFMQPASKGIGSPSGEPSRRDSGDQSVVQRIVSPFGDPSKRIVSPFGDPSKRIAAPRHMDSGIYSSSAFFTPLTSYRLVTKFHAEHSGGCTYLLQNSHDKEDKIILKVDQTLLPVEDAGRMIEKMAYYYGEFTEDFPKVKVVAKEEVEAIPDIASELPGEKTKQNPTNWVFYIMQYANVKPLGEEVVLTERSISNFARIFACDLILGNQDRCIINDKLNDNNIFVANGHGDYQNIIGLDFFINVNGKGFVDYSSWKTEDFAAGLWAEDVTYFHNQVINSDFLKKRCKEWLGKRGLHQPITHVATHAAKFCETFKETGNRLLDAIFSDQDYPLLKNRVECIRKTVWEKPVENDKDRGELGQAILEFAAKIT